MGAKEPCEFSHKNDILSLVEEILHWTKNDQNIWFDDFYLTTIATTVLLKMGHSKNGLNIAWIEEKLRELQSKKRHLTHVDLFAGYCLGLLCLYFVNQKQASLKEKRPKEDFSTLMRAIEITEHQLFLYRLSYTLKLPRIR